MHTHVSDLLDALTRATEAAEGAKGARDVLGHLEGLMDALTRAGLDPTAVDCRDWWDAAAERVAAVDLPGLADLEGKATAAAAIPDLLDLSAEDVDALSAAAARAKQARTTILPSARIKGSGGGSGPSEVTMPRPVTVMLGSERVFSGQSWKALQKQAKDAVQDAGHDWKVTLSALNDVKPELFADNMNPATFNAGVLTVTRS